MRDFTVEDTFDITFDTDDIYLTCKDVLCDVTFSSPDMGVGYSGGMYVDIKSAKVGNLVLTRDDLVAMMGEAEVFNKEVSLSESLCKQDYM